MGYRKSDYGFVYIWRDRKNNRYYIGSHWGPENDGYICSSDWMRKAYQRRPQDFKRRIIKRIYTNKQDLYNEEHRYLQMIKPEELKVRYYNWNRKTFDHWSLDEQKDIYLSVTEKLSRAQKGKSKGPCSPEKAKNISEAKLRNFKENPYVRTVPNEGGWKHSEEWKEAASLRTKEQWENGTRKAKEFQTEDSNQKRSASLKGRKPSQATIEGAKKAFSKTYRVYNHNNGEVFDITNLKEFARINSLSDSNMIKCGSKGYHAYLT